MKISFKRESKYTFDFTCKPFGLLKKIWKTLKSWLG
jgi:hypothetical protein